MMAFVCAHVSGRPSAWVSGSRYALPWTTTMDAAIPMSKRTYGCRQKHRCKPVALQDSDSHTVHGTGDHTQPSSDISSSSNSSSSSSPSNSSPSSLDEEDRKEVDEITSESAQVLDNVAKEVRTDVKELITSSQKLADQMIEEETLALMEIFECQQEQLLQNVKQERRIIQDEVEQIEALSDKTSRRVASKPSVSKARPILLATSVLFAISSLGYMWTGIRMTDSDALRNAGVDMAVAVCAVYFATHQLSQPPSKQ